MRGNERHSVYCMNGAWLILTVDNNESYSPRPDHQGTAPLRPWKIMQNFVFRMTVTTKIVFFFCFVPLFALTVLTHTQAFLSCNSWMCAFGCAQLHVPNRKFPILNTIPSIWQVELRVRVTHTEPNGSFSVTRRMQTHSVENRLSRRTERKIIFFRTSVSHKPIFCPKFHIFFF